MSTLQLRTEGGRFVSVSTPTLPFVFTNGDDDDDDEVSAPNSLSVYLTAPFSPLAMVKLLKGEPFSAKDEMKRNNNNIAAGNQQKDVTEALRLCGEFLLCLDFNITEVDWFGDWVVDD